VKAAPTPGKKCIKLGIVIKTDEKLFTCTLKNKKLVWNKGVSLFSSVPKPRKNLDYAKLNWTNIEQYGFDAIHKLWNDKNSKNYSMTPQVFRKIKVSPNSKLTLAGQVKVFESADRFFSWIELPYQYSVLYVDKQDIEWAKTEYRGMYGQEINLGAICGAKCVGGNAGRVNDEWINVNIGSNTAREGAPSGFIEFHEYTHVVQLALAVNSENFSRVPQWLVEGHANFFAQLGTNNSIEAYSKNRGNYKGDRTTPIPSTNTLLEYLNRTSIEDSSILNGNAYNWGFYFVEAISIVYGLDATISLYRAISATTSFEEAVMQTFDESWESLKPKIAYGANYLMQSLTRA
jgi:hypothetical protein